MTLAPIAPAHARYPSSPGEADVTVLVPTRNEAGNVAPLVAALQPALAGLNAEVLFVDDSTDSTPDVVGDLAARATVPGFRVRLLHRHEGERTGGLGGAVLAGLRVSTAEVAIVMDGDLQHPPAVVPQLLDALRKRGADVVVASRYSGAGSADGLASPLRGLVSSGSTLAARALFPRVLKDVTDPMSGFFAVRRAALDLDALRPRGFKILLEILARSGGLVANEVPFTFADRNDGSSKASWREGVRYLRQLIALRLAPASGIGRFLRFGAIGASGVVVNLVALAVILQTGALRGLVGGELVAAALATQVAIAWNFVLTERLVFPHRAGHRSRRLVPFFALNNIALLAQLPLTARLVTATGTSYLVATGIVIVALMGLRYLVCDTLLFRERRSRRPTAGSEPAASSVAV